MIKFYIVKIDGQAYVYHHDVDRYKFASKFGKLKQI